MRKINNGFRLARENPHTKGAMAKGSIVAVIKLPAMAGATLNSVANKLNNGCGAYKTKKIKTEQRSK